MSIGRFIEIRMQSHDTDCWLCGGYADGHHGVPTFNGDLVSNDFPLWEGGHHVCQSCHGKHERGELEVFDRYYEHHVQGFVNGGGI